MSAGAAQFPYPGNDPGQLAATSSGYTQAAGLLDTLATDTASAATELRSVWTGDTSAMAQTRISDTHDVLTDVRDRLKKSATAVDTYTAVVRAVRARVDELRSQWDTLQNTLAGDRADVRSNATAARTGDETDATATTAIKTATADITRVTHQLDGLQDDYDAQVTKNNTAAHTCAATLTSLRPPTTQGGENGDGKDGEDANLFKRLWEQSEGVREQLDKYRAGWDTLLGDLVLDKTVKYTQASATFMKALPAYEKAWWNEVSSLAHDADVNGDWASVERAYTEYASASGTAERFGTEWLQESRALRFGGNMLKAGGVAFGAVALYGDTNTLLNPEDSGAMGWVDRGAAGTNAVLTGAAMTSGAIDLASAGGLAAADAMTFEIPVVGEATMLGTGLYLGGDYMYHHVKWFHDAADDVGHATATAAKDVGHATVSAVKGIGHAAKSVVTLGGLL